MIDISNRLELFVDHFLIDQLAGTSLRLHHPVRANRAITFDQPWEGAFCGYATVIQDAGQYLLYYRGWPNVENDKASVCYAVSQDGVTFQRPQLDFVTAHGQQQNNVLMTGSEGTHNFAPFLDTRPGVPADERFKALASVHAEKGKALGAFASADGIHWRRLQDEPAMTRGAFDSQNVSFWSEAEGCYVAYYRTWHGGADPTEFAGKRTVSRSTSDDYLHWSDPVEMTYGDTVREELYTNQTHPYFRAPHIYLSTPMRFLPQRPRMTEEEAEHFGVVAKYRVEISDGVFMTTRGGNRYDRTFMEAFLRPGGERANWVSRTNMSACGIVPTGEREISIYYQHRYAQPAQYLERYTLRTDGFISVNAPYAGGEMVTHPLTFTGSQLQLNMATSAPGFIRVEIQNPQGQPLPGFALDDADELYGDDLDRVVTWRGQPSTATLAGQPIRLRFLMKDADLYALQFTDPKS